MINTTISLFVAAFFTVGSHAQPITRLGVIGDSLSDEYAEQNYGSYSMSWSEILVIERGIEMGPTAAQAGVGKWGEPRRTGHEDNWARFGHTTDDALDTGQHTGAANGVVNRGVSHLIVFIGGNDFGPAHGPYSNVYNDTWSQQQIDDYVAQQLVQAEIILDTITGLGAKVLVVNLFDFGAMVSVEGNFPDAEGRERAGAMYETFSEELVALAHARGYPALDMLSLNRAIFGTHSENRNTLRIGGISIRLNVKGPADRPDRAFVDDGTHPKSTIQGVWCNAIIAAFNVAFDTGILPLSEPEILALVGLTPVGPDELDAQLGDLSSYVLLPPVSNCLADTNGDGFVSPSDFSAWVAAFNTQSAACDQNGDGLCTPADFSAWVSNFNEGC